MNFLFCRNLQPAQMFLHRNQMKGKGFRVFLSCVALLAGVVIPAMAQTVLQDFLNFKNSQLTTLVEQATENDARGCGNALIETLEFTTASRKDPLKDLNWVSYFIFFSFE